MRKQIQLFFVVLSMIGVSTTAAIANPKPNLRPLFLPRPQRPLELPPFYQGLPNKKVFETEVLNPVDAQIKKGVAE
jgi:hypothetical protein